MNKTIVYKKDKKEFTDLLKICDINIRADAELKNNFNAITISEQDFNLLLLCKGSKLKLIKIPNYRYLLVFDENEYIENEQDIVY